MKIFAYDQLETAMDKTLVRYGVENVTNDQDHGKNRLLEAVCTTISCELDSILDQGIDRGDVDYRKTRKLCHLEQELAEKEWLLGNLWKEVALLQVVVEEKRKELN